MNSISYQFEQYTGAQLEDAIALVTKTLEAAKTAKTSYDLHKLENKFWTAYLEIDTVEEVINDASTTDVKMPLYLEPGTYLLPEYGYFSSTEFSGISFNPAIATNSNMSEQEQVVLTWLLDNGYYTGKMMTSAAARAAFEAALVKVNDATSSKTVMTNLSENVNVPDASATSLAVSAFYEGKALVKQASEAAITDFDAVDALYTKIDDFETKYCVSLETTISNVWDAALNYYVSANFTADKAALDKIKASEVVANKDAFVAFAEKVLAFEEKYGLDLYGANASYMSNAYVAAYGGTADTPLYNLGTAFSKFDVEAYEPFENAGAALGVNEAQKLTLSDKAAFEAYVAAYDAYKAEVSKDAYEDATFSIDDAAIETEAFILAGKANLEYLANDTDVAASKVDQLLNNATVKVTTVKEGKKVTVNAKVDATTMAQILAGSKVATVEYKFYHKAPGKAYKLTKTKNVNHITYTKSLKAGKNSFRVGVVLKDAKGNVVGEKSYKASTLGYRTIK